MRRQEKRNAYLAEHTVKLEKENAQLKSRVQELESQLGIESTLPPGEEVEAAAGGEAAEASASVATSSPKSGGKGKSMWPVLGQSPAGAGAASVFGAELSEAVKTYIQAHQEKQADVLREEAAHARKLAYKLERVRDFAAGRATERSPGRAECGKGSGFRTSD